VHWVWWALAPVDNRAVRTASRSDRHDLEQIPSLAHRPDGVFRLARTLPVDTTHAVEATTGAVACGIKGHGLEVLNQDWEAAFFVKKCPGCFAAAVARD
jgi:hypothetical protein